MIRVILIQLERFLSFTSILNWEGQQIKAIMTFLKQNNKLSLQIGDRCKGISKSNSSYSLAQNRTNKVVKTLVNIGIQIERLEQKGYRAKQNSECAIDAIPLLLWNKRE
jgi:hypothetical protein